MDVFDDNNNNASLPAKEHAARCKESTVTAHTAVIVRGEELLLQREQTAS